MLDLRKVDVVDFLTALGIRNVSDEGEEVRYSCPYVGHANADESASAYMNAESTAYYCHGCHARGNAVHFLARYEGISPLLAASFIRQRYDQGFREPDNSFQRELEYFWMNIDEDIEEENEPIEYLMDVLPPEAKDYMLGRGFLEETLEAWQIGYDSISGRIAIPVRDHHGRMVGFKGRSFKPHHQPKYLVLGDRPNRSPRYGFLTYLVSRIAFGYNIACTRSDKTLILCEGELDVIALHQMGFTNAVSVGSNVSEYQCTLILAHSAEVVIFFDDDNAGQTGAAKVIDSLDPYIPVRLVGQHDGDPASLPSDECRKLIDEAKSVNELWLPTSTATE